MASTISLGFEVNDGNFKTALKAIDSEIKAMNEGIKAATDEISKLGESEDAVAQRSELLAKVLEANQQKLSALQGEYDKNVQKLNELKEALDRAKESNDPEAIARATNAYNQQVTTVANLETSMAKTSQAITDTKAAMEGAGQETDQLGQSVQELGSKFDLALVQGGIAKAQEALTGFVNGCVEIGKAIWDVASGASTMADDMLTLATKTGMSTTTLQEYGYAARFVDTEVSTITGSMVKLTKNMSSTSEQTQAAFSTLGISVTDASGKMKSTEQVFWEAIDALGNVANETERDQLAMQLFGKSAQDLNPLIKAGSQTWNEYCQEAEQAGLVLSEDGMAALGTFNDGLQRVDATMDAAKNQIMSALAPAFTEIANVVADAAQEFTKWVQTDEAQAMLKAITDTIINLVGEMKNNLSPMLEKVKEAFKKVAEMITFAMEHSDKLVAAFKVLLAAMVALKLVEFAATIMALCNPIGAVVAAVVVMATGLIANWDKIKAAFIAAWEAITEKWDAAKQFFQGIWDGITQTFANVKEWLGEKFSGAWESIKNVWNNAGNFFGEIWETITGVFKKGPGELLEIGKNLIKGLMDGISSMARWLWDAVTNFVETNLVGSIKKFFGIKSPSTYMRDEIGMMLDEGLVEGIYKGASKVQNAYQSLIPNASMFASGADAYTVRSNVNARSGGEIGGSTVMLDNRPIILKLNDREFGRAVRGYA